MTFWRAFEHRLQNKPTCIFLIYVGSARVPVVAMRGQISRISPSGQYEKMVDTVGSETVAIYYPSDSDPLNYRVYWMDNSSTVSDHLPKNVI